MRRILFIICLLLSSAAVVTANPWLTGSEPTAPAERTAPPAGPKFDNPITTVIRPVLDTINGQLEAWAKDIRSNGFSISLLFLVLGAFAYGMLHSMGPGHGKVVLSSYVLSRNISKKQIVLLALAIAAAHALTAIVLVFSIYYIFELALSLTSESARQYMVYISFAVLMILGVYQIISGIRHSHNHSNDHDHNHDDSDKAVDLSGWGVVVAIGVAPCIGTMSLLFMSISFNIIPAGLLAVLALAFGMSVTLTGFGLLAKMARGSIQHKIDKKVNFDRLSHFIAGGFIFFIAGSMFFGAIL